MNEAPLAALSIEMVTVFLRGISCCSFWRRSLRMGLLFAIIMTFPCVPFAQQLDRSALVIGNQNYPWAPLRTPTADAQAMADRLRQAGFDVSMHVDLDQNAFYDAVDQFAAKSTHSRVVLVFYAGHGLQVNGKNYLVPVDVRQDEPDILSRLFDLRYLIDRLSETSATSRLIILDACRNNIFSSHPNAASGLSEIIAPANTFIAFSTAPGATAEDGEMAHSPYAHALLRNLFRPGRRIEDSFKDVRRQVRQITENAQTPWESTSLEHDFIMIPAAGSAPEPTRLAIDQRVADKPPRQVVSRSLNKPTDDCSKILSKISLGIAQVGEYEQGVLRRCN